MLIYVVISFVHSSKQEFIIFHNVFSHFWGQTFNSNNVDTYMKVEMIDPSGKHHEVYIQGSYTRRIFVNNGIPQIISYYHIHEDHVMYLNYMGDYKSPFRIFSLIGDEISYNERPMVNDGPGNVENDDENPFYYSMEKTLTNYDVQCSSFVCMFIYLEFFESYLQYFFNIIYFIVSVFGCPVCYSCLGQEQEKPLPSKLLLLVVEMYIKMDQKKIIRVLFNLWMEVLLLGKWIQS